MVRTRYGKNKKYTPKLIQTTTEQDIHANSTFQQEYIELAYRLALVGLTDEAMLTVFETSVGTFNRWKHMFPEFNLALRKGRIIADTEVVMSLRDKALGYDKKAYVITNHRGVVTKTPYTKHYPAETTAIIYWLKNRQRGLWSDLKHIQNNIDINIMKQAEIDQFSTEELLQVEQICMSKIPLLKDMKN